MGQYYHPVNIESYQYLNPHKIKFYYSHNNKKFQSSVGLKLMEHSYINNPLLNAVERLISPDGAWYKADLVWAGDYADKELGTDKNIYGWLETKGTEVSKSVKRKKHDKKFRFLHNHTKHLIIDLDSIQPDKHGFKIHPLPLLVSEGNGRGGGDFHGEDPRIGTWARDSISLEDHLYTSYTVIDGQFHETL